VLLAIYALMFGSWLLDRWNEQREMTRGSGPRDWTFTVASLMWRLIRNTQSFFWAGVALYIFVRVSLYSELWIGVVVFVLVASVMLYVNSKLFPNPPSSWEIVDQQSADIFKRIAENQNSDRNRLDLSRLEGYGLECKICNDKNGPLLAQGNLVESPTNSGMCLSCALISDEFTGCYPDDPTKGVYLFERYIEHLIRTLGGPAKFQERQHTRNRDTVSNGATSVPRESEVLMRRVECYGSTSHTFVNWISVNPLKYQDEFLKPIRCVLCRYSMEWGNTGYKIAVLNFGIGGWKHKNVTYADLNHRWPDWADPSYTAT